MTVSVINLNYTNRSRRLASWCA